MAWRRLLKVRSLAQAEQVWESSKYEVPLYVKWVRAAQKVKATAYNAEKAVDEYLTGEKEKTVQVAFMITRENKAKLAQLGYSKDAISHLQPAVAMAVLEEGVVAADFDDWLAATAGSDEAVDAEVGADELVDTTGPPPRAEAALAVAPPAADDADSDAATDADAAKADAPK